MLECYYILYANISVFLCEVSEPAVNISDRTSNSPLYYAIQHNKNYSTMLHKVCGYIYIYIYGGDIKEVHRCYLDLNCAVNAPDNDGKTPL